MKKLLNTIYVTNPDSYLSLDGDNLVVMREEKKVRMPLHNVERIMTFGYTGASPALMGKCAKDGRELVFMTSSGKFLARVEGAVSGNVLLRRHQYRVADDADASLSIARNMIVGKLFNSRWVLERMIRDHAPRIDAETFRQKSQFLQQSISKAAEADLADTLRGIEGEAASVYFSVFDDMILKEKAAFAFHGRNKRPSLDRVNAMLNFAYSLMTGMCSAALESVGLDPYVGVLHTDRPDRPSLSLDLVEEFRALCCDRFVLTLINRGMIHAEDFDVQCGGLFKQRLNRCAVLSDDIGVISSGISQPVTFEIEFIRKQVAVHGAEGTEGIRGEKDLVRGVIRHHDLRPVYHGGHQEGEGMSAGTEGVVFFHDHGSGIDIKFIELLDDRNRLCVADHGDVRISSDQFAECCAVVRFHMIDDHIVQRSSCQNGFHIFEKLPGDCPVDRVEENGFFI